MSSESPSRRGWVAIALSLALPASAQPLPNAVPEPPRALNPQGRQNLVAFTKAMNYIRYFHPSDEAAKADWEALSAAGVRAVEGAGSPQELAQRLQTFLAPYAPSLQVLTVGQSPSLPKQPADAMYATRWEHFGFGGHPFPGSVYHSERVYAPLAERNAKGWADPLSPATQEIGDGLRMWMPSVCFADSAKATLPRASKEPVLPASKTSSGNDRATRLGDVALAWGVFRHFYPYADVNPVDWDALLDHALAQAAVDADAQAFRHTLRRLLAPLKDGHMRVWMEGDGQSSPSLALVMREGHPLVRRAEGSAQGLPFGSEIVALDGRPVALRLATLRAEISAASEGWMNVRLMEELMSGPKDSKVRIAYRTPAGALAEATLPLDSDPWSVTLAGRPEPLSELRPGLWYVDLARLTAEAFDAALPKLEQAKGLIFDVRGYPRMEPDFLCHLSNQAMESAQWNVPFVTEPEGRGWT